MPTTKRPPAPKLYMGTGKTVEEATEKAWKSAERAGRTGWFRIVSIEFYADNPIRDYKVYISGGH